MRPISDFTLGARIKCTQEEFIKYAPLGLILTDGIDKYHFDNTEPPTEHYKDDHRYRFNKEKLSGCWSEFNGKRVFTVKRPPIPLFPY